jgi:hypothetical protein
MNLDINDDEQAALTRLLRETVAADRFPLSPRVRPGQGAAGGTVPAAEGIG